MLITPIKWLPIFPLLLVVMISKTFAEPADDAQTFVNNLGDRAIRMLSDKNLTKEQKISEFRILLNAGFDIPLIARYALGKYWRPAEKKKRQEYAEVFEEFIVGVYAARLGQFGGETFAVTGVQADGKKDFIVSSIVKPPSGVSINVDWRVRKREDNYKILDVIIEGVSMIITQRDEFSAIVQRSDGNIDGLINKLRNYSVAK